MRMCAHVYGWYIPTRLTDVKSFSLNSKKSGASLEVNCRCTSPTFRHCLTTNSSPVEGGQRPSLVSTSLAR